MFCVKFVWFFIKKICGKTLTIFSICGIIITVIKNTSKCRYEVVIRLIIVYEPNCFNILILSVMTKGGYMSHESATKSERNPVSHSDSQSE